MSRSKAKGTWFESAVVTFLNAHGFPYAERRALTGNKDKGDISGVIGMVLECKNGATMTLGPWLKEANAEAANAGVPIGVVVHHRYGKGEKQMGEQFVTMTLETFCLLAGDPVIEEATA